MKFGKGKYPDIQSISNINNNDTIDDTKKIGDKRNPIYPNTYKAQSKNMQEKFQIAYFKGYFSDNNGNNLGFQEFAEKENLRIGFFDEKGNFPIENDEKNKENLKNISIKIGENIYKLRIDVELKIYFRAFLGDIVKDLENSGNLQDLENGINNIFKSLLENELNLRNESEIKQPLNIKKIENHIKTLEKKPIKIVQIGETRKSFKDMVGKILKKKK